MLATGNWQIISKAGKTHANVSGLSNLNDPTGYRAFLDRLAMEITR